MANTNKKVFAVFGLGVFGSTVAEVLSRKGGEVIVVDKDPVLVDAFKNKATTALLIDSTDEKALAKAPIEDVDVAIVAMGDNLEVNIITTALLKQRGIPYIVCRAISKIHAQVLKQIGANEVINLQENAGSAIAHRLIAPEVLSKVELTNEYSFAEMYVPQLFVGQPCEKMELLKKFSLRLSAIKRLETTIDNSGNPIQKETIIFPEGSEIILESADIIMVVGKNSDIEEFKKLL
ncbi:MAG: potassium transporter TrkA [Treponema sp.]|nr:MAG: potassium transporter TrkA [Treponema sp.]